MLNISYNHILEIPSCASLLEKLAFLDLSNNSIDTLHPNMWLLSSLEVLKLDHNNMGGVRKEKEVAPEDVNLFSRISTSKTPAEARVKYYSMQTITEHVSKLVNLRTLTLSHNFLKTLPPALGRLTCLTELWIQSNPLSCIPDTLSDLNTLSVFTVDSGVPGVASLRQLVIFDEPEHRAQQISPRSPTVPLPKPLSFRK
jgi:internalin A